MITTLQDYVEASAFERTVLSTVYPFVNPAAARGGYDLRTNAARIVLSDDVGSGGRDDLLRELRPLLFGAAWKVLDLLVEYVLNQVDPRPKWQIDDKKARVAGVTLPPLSADAAIWSRISATYTNTIEQRHCLVHRSFVMTPAGAMTQMVDLRGNTVQDFSVAETFRIFITFCEPSHSNPMTNTPNNSLSDPANPHIDPPMSTSSSMPPSNFNITLHNFDPCEDLDQIEPAQAITPIPSVVFEQIGSIKVLHGVTRATAANGKTFLRVLQSVELPTYTNQATVFLNGWEAAYNGSNQNLLWVSAVIGRIQVIAGTQGTPGKITWNATGLLRDNDSAEAFTWTYHYTIIAWNDVFVHAMVDQNDSEHFCESKEPNGDDNFFMGGNFGDNIEATTALSSFSSFLKNGGFSGGRQVAVLPRGFAFFWNQSPDHKILQLAYNLESVAPFVRPQPYHKANSTINPLGNSAAAQAGGEFVSWKTSVIMKDNSRRHDYKFVEFVSGMGGQDVEIIQPEFTILPREDIGGASSGANLKSAEVVINNLPYLCAVPILTGWDIGYARDNQKVKELGIFLENVKYEHPTTSSVGTLRYKVSSIVKDNDFVPDNYFRHKVTILGLKPTGVVVPPAG